MRTLMLCLFISTAFLNSCSQADAPEKADYGPGPGLEEADMSNPRLDAPMEKKEKGSVNEKSSPYIDNS